jgi:hydrogenase maturation protease
MKTMRILIAGVGNVLRGDDAFGIEVLRCLQESPAMEGVSFFESGIAGISLVQELMDGFDALIIVDALDRGAEPGRVFILQPDEVLLARGATYRESTDLHQADPEAVLRMAHAIGVLPPRVWIVGCQAIGCDDLGAPLSEAVAHAVPIAVDRVRKIVEQLGSKEAHHVVG